MAFKWLKHVKRRVFATRENQTNWELRGHGWSLLEHGHTYLSMATAVLRPQTQMPPCGLRGLSISSGLLAASVSIPAPDCGQGLPVDKSPRPP